MEVINFIEQNETIIRLSLMLLGLTSLFLVAYQIRISTKWNKLKEALSFLNNSKLGDLEQSLYKQTKGKYNLTAEIPSELIEEIYGDHDLYFGVKKYLDEIEKISAAVNIGAFDYDFAYATFSPKVIYNYKTFLNFIKKIRTDNEDDEIYLELEKLALDWESKMLKERESNMEKISRQKNKLLELSGIKKKV